MVELTPEIMVQQSLTEELEAISAYANRIGTLSQITTSYSTQLIEILKHNIVEEKNHAGKLQNWLAQYHPEIAQPIFVENPSSIEPATLLYHEPTPKLSILYGGTIAKDSMREEMYAIKSYKERYMTLQNFVHRGTNGAYELQTIFDTNLYDEREHATSLLGWLKQTQYRWQGIPMPTNGMDIEDIPIITLELNSFMPSYQEEWAPWWGPRPTSGSGTKTTRTSRGGPSGGQDKTTYIKGLQSINPSIDMTRINRWFSNTDKLVTKWRKVKIKKNIWDPNAYDTTFNRKGAIVEINEETMVPPPQFVKRWGRRIVIEKPEGTYRIDASATAKKGYPGNYLVTLYIAPRMMTVGQTYKLREEEYAMLYKKDMSVEECEYKTNELIRLIKSL